MRETGGVRARRPNLQTVEERLIAGERPGYDKFSYSHSDRSSWDHVDHLANLLYDIRLANTKSVEGVFFKKGFTESEINHRIWILVKNQEYNCAPSRRKQQPSSAAMPPQPSQEPAFANPPIDPLVDPPADETTTGETTDSPAHESTDPPADMIFHSAYLSIRRMHSRLQMFREW